MGCLNKMELKFLKVHKIITNAVSLYHLHNFTGLKRRARCGECDACRRQDCGKCVNCLDKKKFSGYGRKKQCCVERKCKNLVHPNKVHLDVSSPQDDTTSLIVDQGIPHSCMYYGYTCSVHDTCISYSTFRTFYY